MSHHGHFTTRRGFVGAMGFGALGLYATWAAYGASPLPFASGGTSADAPTHSGHGGEHGAAHGGAADPAVADAHGAARLSPAEFEERHTAFVKAFRQADGSVRPVAAPVEPGAPATAGHDGHDAGMAMDHGAMPMNHGDMSMNHGTMSMDHGAMPTMHGEPDAAATAGHDGHAMSMPADPGAMHMSHTAGAEPAPAEAPAAQSHGHAAAMPEGHGAAGGQGGGGGHEGHESHEGHDGDAADAPIEVFLTAGRFAFEPDDLRLERGRTYRFHMMATDVAHGASIAFGRASRIVRLRPETVTTLDLTFREAGRHLLYCTVYCGPGHDAMHASITVA